MAIISVQVEVDDTIENLNSLVGSGESVRSCTELQDLFGRLASGHVVGRFLKKTLNNDSPKEWLVACTRAEAEGAVFSVDNVDLTEGVAGDFLRGASDDETATNLLAAIQLRPEITSLFESVTRTDNDVIFTALVGGPSSIRISTDTTAAFGITVTAEEIEDESLSVAIRRGL